MDSQSLGKIEWMPMKCKNLIFLFLNINEFFVNAYKMINSQT